MTVLTISPRYTQMLLAGPVVPKIKFGEDNVQAVNRDNVPLFTAHVLPLGNPLDRKPEVITVSLALTDAKPAQALGVGQNVQLDNLTARAWQSDNRSGVSFSADAISLAKAAA